MVDPAAAGGGLHVVLGHVLGDPHCPKDALAVICAAATHVSSRITKPTPQGPVPPKGGHAVSMPDRSHTRGV